MSKIKILVTNDDGVYSDGLDLLTKAAQLLGDVVVVAPKDCMSGAGSGHHLYGSFTVRATSEKGRFALEVGLKGRAGFSATPVDCVRYSIARFKPDLVLVGINNGPNLGENTLCSGTVCAAAMAVNLGVKMAIALSMYKPDWKAWPVDRVAALISHLMAKNIQYHQVAFNVNLPSKCPKKITPDSFCMEPADCHNVMPMKILKTGEIKLSVYPRLGRKLKEKIFYSPISFQA